MVMMHSDQMPARSRGETVCVKVQSRYKNWQPLKLVQHSKGGRTMILGLAAAAAPERSPSH